MRNFTGRDNYLKELENIWEAGHTRLIAFYGRRRVGKTALIQFFSRNKRVYLFEAIEGEETPVQVRHFLDQLSKFTNQPHFRDLNYRDWPPVFDLLTQVIQKEKSLLLSFDELSWMAAGRTKLVGIIKYYWDRYWKNHPHLLLILCGSVASWMIKNVVRSNALYGRISESFLIEPLKPFEVAEFVGKKRGQSEVLEYLLSFGGIPRYLEEFDFNKSIQLNIERTCFQKSSFFKEEAEKIFYNQFRETRIYKQIVKHLLKASLPLKDIAERIKVPSGGGLKNYIENLIAANIVEKIPEIKHFKLGGTYRYYLVDEFLRFYSWFIQPHLTEINNSDASASKFEKFTKNRWSPFLGHAFERFCLRHRYRIADLMGCGSKVVGCGSLLNSKKDGFQYDLVFLRNDGVITLCEVKYLSEEISTRLIKEFEDKLKATPFPKGVTIEKVLISNQRPTKALLESGYFHHILSAEEILTLRH